MIPQRVTDELLGWLRGTRLAPIMVIHVNHANEIDETTAAAIARLVDAGIPVLNQAVLLAGVNDSADALIDLSRRLVELRVMPYYLHQLDRVQGAAHFEVPISRGLELINEMRRALPGYAVPRYVQEIAGEAQKIVLA
jgi:KamA family protein